MYFHVACGVVVGTMEWKQGRGLYATKVLRKFKWKENGIIN